MWHVRHGSRDPKHTGARAAKSARGRRAPLLVVSLAIACATSSSPARAERGPLAGNVVWAEAARVYFTARDSSAVAPGDWITFVDRNRAVARGAVSRNFGDGLCVAIVDSGSIDRVKHRDRLRLLIERPAPVPVALLRVGVPSQHRACAWFRCGVLATRVPLAWPGYRIDSPGHGIETPGDVVVRVVRDSAFAARPGWPETLSVRGFDESGDEEIALERGEIDVALFWPGELSSHVRDQPCWQQDRYATMNRGVIAAWPVSADEPAPPGARADPIWTALEQDLFRGDLVAWEYSGAPPSSASAAAAGPPATRARRFEVDPSCPGRIALEQFLNREPGAGATTAASVTRVFFLDARTDDADAVALAAAEFVRHAAPPGALRVRAEALAAALKRGPGDASIPRGQLASVLADSLHVVPLFTMRCPVLSAPAFSRTVDRMGMDAFVPLIECATVGGRP
jgi:hypothetical protein